MRIIISPAKQMKVDSDIQAEDPEQMKEFSWSGYHYDKDRSNPTEYVFIRTEAEKGC